MTTPTVYGARTIKRARRTKAALAQLDRQIVDALRGDHPQSVRHVFYLMTNPRLPEPVEKSERGYRAVQHRCADLRRCGALSYGWIVDSTRRGYFTDTFQNGADFLRSVIGLYRADLWQDAEYYVEVWTESRSIAGVIENDCRELAVSLYPAGGFSSISLAYSAAEGIAANCGGKPVMIFYIGDYDPAGVLIDVSLEQELRRHLPADIELMFCRLGITASPIEKYDLPTNPRKKMDRRARHIAETVEAEAMPAEILRTLLREHIERLLPQNALNVARVAESSEREHLQYMAELMEGDA